MRLINKDCFDVFNEFPDKHFDCIIADLPYQVTKCKWDTMLPLEPLWEQYKRIIKDNGCIILFGQGIFSAKLILSNEKDYKYTIIYEKTTPTGHLNSKKMPLRSHEDILVFYKKQPTYNPQKTTGHVRKVSSANSRIKSIERASNRDKVYNNEDITKVPNYDSTERFPTSVWKIKTDKQKSKLHPTQKPLELLKRLILTYSNEGDYILDNVMGSGTTGVACKILNRNFTGIEKDTEMFDIAKNRIYTHENN